MELVQLVAATKSTLYRLCVAKPRFQLDPTCRLMLFFPTNSVDCCNCLVFSNPFYRLTPWTQRQFSPICTLPWRTEVRGQKHVKHWMLASQLSSQPCYVVWSACVDVGDRAGVECWWWGAWKTHEIIYIYILHIVCCMLLLLQPKLSTAHSSKGQRSCGWFRSTAYSSTYWGAELHFTNDLDPF